MSVQSQLEFTSLRQFPEDDLAAYYLLDQYTCTRCPLHKLFVSRGDGKLRGHGHGRNVLFLAQNPASNRKGIRIFNSDNENDRLFIDMLTEIGIERDAVYVTNLVKCSSKTNDPPESSVEPCQMHFRKELEILRPRLIVAVGAFSRRFLQGDNGKVTTWNGYSVTAIRHPAYYLRNRDIESYRKEFAFLKKIINSTGGI